MNLVSGSVNKMSEYRNKKQQKRLCDKLWTNANTLCKVEKLLTKTEFLVIQSMVRKAKARVKQNG